LYRQQLIELCQNKLLENQVNKEKELEKVSNTTNIKKKRKDVITGKSRGDLG